MTGWAYPCPGLITLALNAAIGYTTAIIQSTGKITARGAEVMAGNSGGQDRPPFELYYSFAPQDEKLCLQLETYLKQLERQHLIKGWHRGKALAGVTEDQEIESHRERANGILL